MTPEETFELELQDYERSVRKYRIAQETLWRELGPLAANYILKEAGYRVCRASAEHGAKIVVISEEEVNRQAAKARPIVDGEASPLVIDASKEV